jgi:tetratricopeptide (TPR) repeat protein
MKNYEGAIESYSEVLRLTQSSHHGDTLLLRGDVREGAGDYQGALEDYTEALRLDPSYVGAFLLRGQVREKLEDYSGALADYEEVLRLDPTNTEANGRVEDVPENARDSSSSLPMVLYIGCPHLILGQAPESRHSALAQCV